MKMKRFGCAAIALIMAASMTACSSGEEPASSSAPVEPVPTEPASSEAKPVFNEGLDRVRQDMEPSAAIAGIFYMGYCDGTVSDVGFFSQLQNQTALLEYPFILEIPEERFAKNEGGELYCIVPADPQASVEVTAWDDMEQKAGEVLYQSDSGEPFFVSGNVSDIMSNLSVNIRDSYGNALEQYHPFLSLESGMIALQDGPVVLDFTSYADDEILYSFDVYVPNEDKSEVELVRSEARSLDEALVLQRLVEQRVLPETVVINSFQEGMYDLTLDLNGEFQTYLDGMQDWEADMYVTCVANSYLSAYGADVITITVDGGTLEAGGHVYSEPLALTVG